MISKFISEGIDDDAKLADEFAAANDLGADESIVKLFNPAEKEKLMKMIKHHEFNQVESAVLKALMSEVFGLEDLAVFIGAHSPRTKGNPTSKPAALKELNRILQVVAKRSKLKLGKAVDLSQIPKIRREMKAQSAQRKREMKAKQKWYRQQQAIFWKELRELNKVERANKLEPSRYDRAFRAKTYSVDAAAAHKD